MVFYGVSIRVLNDSVHPYWPRCPRKSCQSIKIFGSSTYGALQHLLLLFLMRYNLTHCWGQIFHITWLHFIGDPYHINIIMDFGKTSLKAQKNSYLHKRRQSPWFKLIAHHLIFGSWSKLMSLIGGILGVVIRRAKKCVM